MTDQPTPGRPDVDDRAERALREALDRGASDPGFAPRDPADLALRARVREPDAPLAARRRSGSLRPALVAAAIVVIAAPVGFWAAGRLGSGPTLSAASTAHRT